MENQATETFKTENYEWRRHGSDAVAPTNDACILPRKWRAQNVGNGMINMVNGKWSDDDFTSEAFEPECKRALRALVGPPPWETQAPAASSDGPRERIKSIGERLASLSNEAEHGFAELSAIAIGLVDERDRLQIISAILISIDLDRRSGTQT